MFKKYKEMKKQLLGNGNFRRYILYAIGEIILVMIGILLALQVNEWNENNLKRKEETRILIGFKKDLSNDIIQLGNIILSTQKRMQEIDSIFTMMHHPSIELMPTFIKFNEKITQGDLFELNSGTFDESLGSGKISYIQNDSLRGQIFEYYRKINENLTQSNAYKVLMETIIPKWGEILIPSKEALDFLGLENSMPSLSLEELKRNKKYNWILAQTYGSHGTLIRLWQNYFRIATNLKLEIEKEL